MKYLSTLYVPVQALKNHQVAASPAMFSAIKDTDRDENINELQ